MVHLSKVRGPVQTCIFHHNSNKCIVCCVCGFFFFFIYLYNDHIVVASYVKVLAGCCVHLSLVCDIEYGVSVNSYMLQ